MKAFLRIFFDLLYHPFAFAYDFVAATVSFGQWKNWILEVIPFIEGKRTLEIGHGPGHLHRVLLDRGLVAVAMDESAAMGRLAKRNLAPSLRAKRQRARRVSNLQNNEKTSSQHGIASSGDALLAMTGNLTRGLGQQLPFASGSFDSVIATFPAEYITEARTLSEVRRCLSDGGRFIVLPAAMPKSGFLEWLYRVTGETPSNALEFIRERMEKPFVQAGFDVETHLIERESGTLVILVGKAQAAVS